MDFVQHHQPAHVTAQERIGIVGPPSVGQPF
jgi:hypothetical protein